MSHEILIKNQVDLHKYLVAICCKDFLLQDNDNTIRYIKKYYKNVLILDHFPSSAFDFMLKYFHKYRKYKSKYFALK